MVIQEAVAGSWKELRYTAGEVFDFLFPLVMMDVARRRLTGAEIGPPGFGPSNRWCHFRALPSAGFSKEFSRPSFDVLYSSLWADLRNGPVHIHKPHSNRYHTLQMMDYYAETFHVVGSRTTGQRELDMLLVSPFEEMPDVSDKIDVVVCPTPIVWLVCRVSCDESEDLTTVHRFQDKLGIDVLGSGSPQLARIPVRTEPLDYVHSLSGAEFFEYGLELMDEHPPHFVDQPMVALMERLGFVPGMILDTDDELAEMLTEVKDQRMRELVNDFATGDTVLGWTTNTNLGAYGANYKQRAATVLMGIAAMRPEDIVYSIADRDGAGEPLFGENTYELTFPAGELPPAQASWSLTAYDADGVAHENEWNKYKISSSDDLMYHGDGALTVFISNTPQEPFSNWLPAPRGAASLVLRLYSPERRVLAGFWTPPGINLRAYG